MGKENSGATTSAPKSGPKSDPKSDPKSGPGPGSVETELKLTVAPGDLDRIGDIPVIADNSRNRGQHRTLVAQYYDTSDRRLLQRKMTLRVRKEGRRFIQTVKTASTGNGGYLARGEWSTDVDGWAPSLARFGDEALRTLLGFVQDSELEPVFTTRIRRHRRIVDLPSARPEPGADDDAGPDGDAGESAAAIEVSVDRGSVSVGDLHLPVAEVELELLAGEPEALYRLAGEIAEHVPARPSLVNKAALGWRLTDSVQKQGEGVEAQTSGTTGAGTRADLTVAAPWKAAEEPDWSSHDDPTSEDALRAIMAACLDQLVSNADAARNTDDPEGVHQMRIAARRLRAAAAVFDQVLPEDAAARLKAGAGMIGHALGPARDWDVLLAETLPRLRSLHDGRSVPREEASSARSWNDLAALSDRRRVAAYDDVVVMVDGGDFGRFAIWLGWWIESCGWRCGCPNAALLDYPVRSLAATRLADLHRKVCSDARKFGTLDIDERHDVRKRAKKLRYAVDFFASLYKPKRTKPYRKALRSIQDRLGHLNDAAVARELMSGLRDDPSADFDLGLLAGSVNGWLDFAAADSLDHADGDWRKLLDVRPFWDK